MHLHIQKIPCYIMIDRITLVPKLAPADPTHQILVESKLTHSGQLSADSGPIFY
jgi:hypothetical protein